jgi:hypothetical protein
MYFMARVHQVVSPNGFHLEQEEFYQAIGGIIPELPHLELEIVQPENDELARHGLHIHREPETGKPFVCYARRMADLDEAMKIFSVWCLGSTGKIETDVEMNDLIRQDCAGDPNKLSVLMQERFGIRIVSAERIRG